MAKNKSKPTPQKLRALWDAVIQWRDENKVSCAESLMQVDSVNEDLPELAEKVLDITGYWEQ